MKNAVIYAKHVCVRNYEPNISSQIAICQKYADKENMKIHQIYSDCVPTKMSDLSNYKKLMEDAKTKKFDTILVSSATILGRNYQKILNLKSMLFKSGINLILIDSEEKGLLKLFLEATKK